MFALVLTLSVIVFVNTLGFIFSEYSWELSTWNPALIITCSECCKCIVSTILFFRQSQPISLKNMKLWAIPGLMYTTLNTLTAFAFKYLPAHFVITVSSLKIVFSMFLSTYYLNQTFTKQQWLAGIVILVGLVIIYLSPFDGDSTKMSFSILFGVCSGLLSAGAGVFCEYLYFIEPEESIHAQNTKLYLFGILFNLLYVLARSQYITEFHWTHAVLIFQYAFAGILVSYVLKYLGNVVRNIIGALTVVSVTVASHLLLGNNITPKFVGGAFCVIVGTLMFYFGYKNNRKLGTSPPVDDELT